MSQNNTIKPLEAYDKLPDVDIVNRGTAVVTKMTGNANFPTPPVDLAGLQADIDALSTLMAEALDGSKKVVAEKRKQKRVVVKKLRLLGRYVEYLCQDDIAIFVSSGFEPASTTKARPQGVSQIIRSLKHGGNSGEIVVRLNAVPKALSYELRYVVPDSVGSTPTWTIEIVTGVKTPVTLSGLKPGTIYAFQVRSLGKSGYSDWSDSTTLMCT